MKKSPTIIKVGGDNPAFESEEGRADPPGLTTKSAAIKVSFQRFHELNYEEMEIIKSNLT